MNPLQILKAMRPKQWTKNILLIAGLYFPARGSTTPGFLDADSLLRAVAGFFVFCGLAGSIYIVNDIIDAPKDRLHPKKRKRPIASGKLKPAVALVAAVIVGPGAMLGAFYLSTAFGLCAAAYFVMQIVYSAALKEIMLVDVMVIAMGFILRAVSGIIVLRTADNYVDLTFWFVVAVMFLSLLLGFSKRRGELMRLEGDSGSHRKVLREYSPHLLDSGITICAAGTILSYALYASQNPEPWKMLATMPFLIFGIFRYLHLLYNIGEGDSPEDVFLHDRPILGCVAIWMGILFFVFY